MQSADLRDSHDLPLFRQLHLPRLRRVLRQRQMRPRFVIIRDERFQMIVQVGFVENDQMVEALTADRTDQALHVGSLPRGPRRRQNLLDSHCRYTLAEFRAKDAIPIPQQVSRDQIKWEGLPQLLQRPFRRWMRGHVEWTIRRRS